MAAITNLFRAVTYRGREGYIAWLLHRITGIGVFTFLALFSKLLFFYHQFVFRLLIIFGLYLGVLYHALNGMRVVIIDFWPGMGKYEAPLWRIQMVIFALAYIPSAAVMLIRMFDGQ
jgi:succinate dehydrogenase / fumarate reductase cytochrome b subunit